MSSTSRERAIYHIPRQLIANEEGYWLDELNPALKQLCAALTNNKYGRMDIYCSGQAGYLLDTAEQILAKKAGFPEIPVASGNTGETLYFIPPLANMQSIADTAQIAHSQETPNLWVAVTRDAAQQPISTHLFTFPTYLIDTIGTYVQQLGRVISEEDVTNTILENVFGISIS